MKRALMTLIAGGEQPAGTRIPGYSEYHLGCQIHTWEFYRRAAVGCPPHIVTLYPSLLYVSRMIMDAQPVTCVIDIYVHLHCFGVWVGLLNKGQC